ncbi:MAG: 2-oxo acid dehydrogenase subunit E2 [Holosporales bacterium]|jgi:pyruvate dehydrogenase E2 component (dihydrolipoamide acetyltransferase)|nr:2-oxo acid dehydrogenase subunit E2 [Holosporales bacterium]
MPSVLEMPAMSPTMQKGNLVKWCKKEGDAIEIGDVLAEIDTDKAIMEIESTQAGFLEKFLVNAGTKNIKIQTPIAVIRQKSDSHEQIQKFMANLSADHEEENLVSPQTSNSAEQISKIIPSSAAKFVPNITADFTSLPKTDDLLREMTDATRIITEKQTDDRPQRIFASPLAKKVATLHSIDLSGVNGTGPGGRIVKEDVLLMLAERRDSDDDIDDDGADITTEEEPASATVASDGKKPLAEGQIVVKRFIDETIPGIKRVIAEKMRKAKNECPHFYMSISADVTDLLALRKKINESSNLNLTVTDFLIKAVAMAIRENPDINVAYKEDNMIRRFASIDISVAVATEFGLFTPIILHADKKNLRVISTELKELADLARKRKLKPRMYTGGSITISNLGMYEIDSFYSILNIPQASILSVGPALKTPIFDENDRIRKAMIVQIGYAIDHRVIEGQSAARFLVSIKKFLSDPVLLIIDSFSEQS